MSISARELQEKIRLNIPLSENMQFEIVELDEDSIHVQAPLAPNVNIHGTGFAGSIYSLAVLAGWAKCTQILSVNKIDAELVVARAEIKYRRAVTGDIDCRCSVDELERQAFIEEFENRGKSKLELTVIVGDDRNAVLTTTYVAIE